MMTNWIEWVSPIVVKIAGLTALAAVSCWLWLWIFDALCRVCRLKAFLAGVLLERTLRRRGVNPQENTHEV